MHYLIISFLSSSILSEVVQNFPGFIQALFLILKFIVDFPSSIILIFLLKYWI